MRLFTSLEFSFIALIYIVTVVPASLLIPLKVFALVWIFLLVLKEYVCNRERVQIGKIEFSVVLTYGCSILFLSLLTIYYGEVELQSVLSATVRYTMVIAITYLGMQLVRSSYITIDDILRSIFLGHFIYLLMKIATMLMFRYMELEADQILELSATLIPRATDHGFSGDSNLVRIFIGNDAISPTILAVYFIYYREQLRVEPIWGSIFITCVLIGSALTFTRFVWVSLFVVLLIQGVISIRMFSLRVFFRIAAMTTAALGVIIYIVYSGDGIGGGAAERGMDTGSLEEKLTQIKLMWEAFTEHPIFGTGVGSHLEIHPSTSEITYLYEVQWFSLLMQLGLFGILPLIVISTSPLWPTLNAFRTKGLKIYCIYMIASYGLWLLGAFTNPYLFIMSSVAVYLSVLMGSIDLSNGSLSNSKRLS